MGQPLRPPLRLKVEVEARPSAGTGPTAGRLELTAGNANTSQINLPTHKNQHNTCRTGVRRCQPQGWENWAGRGSDQRRAKVTSCVDGLS